MRNRFLFSLLFFVFSYLTFYSLNCIFLKLKDIQLVKEPKKSREIDVKICGGSLISVTLWKKFLKKLL